MRVKPEPIVIEEPDIFQNDRLNRKEEIENLSSLVGSIDTPLVLSLNSPWGTGKTTFARLWAASLKTHDKAVIYFNAWETDFSADPLLSFLGEIDQDFHELAGGSEASAAAWENTKKIGSKIARRGIPAIVKLATAGILDASDLVEGEASEFFAGLSEDSIDAYASQKSAISDFRESVANALTRLNGAGPIVIFIDELDRCRPSYAILLLERVKHLFNVHGIVFVLSVDIDQLSHSIKAIYGGDFDARGYLKRFIDVEYVLAEPNRKDFISNLYAAYEMESFFAERRRHSSLQYESDHFRDTFEVLNYLGKDELARDRTSIRSGKFGAQVNLGKAILAPCTYGVLGCAQTSASRYICRIY